MPVATPTPSRIDDPTQGPTCLHRVGCSCRRPTLGRALVTTAAIQVVLAVVTMIAGAPLIGLVACGAMALSMMVAVVAEVLAHHRFGLVVPDDTEIGRTRGVPHRPGQAFW